MALCDRSCVIKHPKQPIHLYIMKKKFHHFLTIRFAYLYRNFLLLLQRLLLTHFVKAEKF